MFFSLAAHLMRVRDPDGRLLPHARQWSELSIFFYAGMETTAHTIAWCACMWIGHLARHRA